MAKKRLILLLIIAALVLSLFGCGPKFLTYDRAIEIANQNNYTVVEYYRSSEIDAFVSEFYGEYKTIRETYPEAFSYLPDMEDFEIKLTEALYIKNSDESERAYVLFTENSNSAVVLSFGINQRFSLASKITNGEGSSYFCIVGTEKLVNLLAKDLS